jgi:NAD(P)-dependent dehydrogenase (short-subunit alcohol dehydrogenase family)
MPVALLTGGGSVLGEGITCALVARGWTVAVTDINLDLARQVAGAAGGMPHAEAFALDATERVQVDALVKTLLARHGGIDALVNAAGGMRGLGIAKTDFAHMSPEAWNRILHVNLQSVLHCTHTVLPSMIAAKRGAIVSIAASRGLRGGPGASIYSAAKAAIIVFSQSLAQEVGMASASTPSRPAMRRRAGRRTTRRRRAARLDARPQATTWVAPSRSCCRTTPRISPALASTSPAARHCTDHRARPDVRRRP